MSTPIVDPRVEHTIAMFSRIYLGGIPPTITDDSAFLSFISMLTATEALAGFRYATESRAGFRFNEFVRSYFPVAYHQHTDGRLWRFRNKMIHAFSPEGFTLTHHQSDRHFATAADGNPILNAEDVFTALVTASQSYFTAVRSDTALQSLLVTRLEHEEGGGIGIGPIAAPGMGDTSGTSTSTL